MIIIELNHTPDPEWDAKGREYREQFTQRVDPLHRLVDRVLPSLLKPHIYGREVAPDEILMPEIQVIQEPKDYRQEVKKMIFDYRIPNFHFQPLVLAAATPVLATDTEKPKIITSVPHEDLSIELLTNHIYGVESNYWLETDGSNASLSRAQIDDSVYVQSIINAAFYIYCLPAPIIWETMPDMRREALINKGVALTREAMKIIGMPMAMEPFTEERINQHTKSLQ